MQKERIYEDIQKLLQNKLRVNPALLVRDNFDLPLTGKEFGFTARDLIYLFFEIEKKFNIKIEMNCLSNNKFNTIEGICEIIMEYMSMFD